MFILKNKQQLTYRDKPPFFRFLRFSLAFFLLNWTIAFSAASVLAEDVQGLGFPITAASDNKFQSLVIKGNYFQDEPTVVVTKGGTTSTLPSSQVTFVNSTKLIISLQLGAEANTWQLNMINPDGQYSTNTIQFDIQAPPARGAVNEDISLADTEFALKILSDINPGQELPNTIDVNVDGEFGTEEAVYGLQRALDIDG